MGQFSPHRFEWIFRAAVGVVALISFALGVLLPGPIALTAGMLGYLTVPLILQLPVGVPLRSGESVRIITGATGARRLDDFARMVGGYSWLTFGAMSLLGRGTNMVIAVFGALIGMGCALIALWGLWVRVVTAGGTGHSITLDRTSVTIRTVNGTHVIAYADLGEIETEGTNIWLPTATERHVVAVSGSAQLTADIGEQIREAKLRADREVRDEALGVKELERPAGMSVREWLGRIDAIAAANRDKGPYRTANAAALDEAHLWSLLGDDQADVATRAAAARVLASSEDANMRVRVAASAGTVLDEGTRVRIELAIKPDADEAAEAIEALEMDELKKSAGV